MCAGIGSDVDGGSATLASNRTLTCEGTARSAGPSLRLTTVVCSIKHGHRIEGDSSQRYCRPEVMIADHSDQMPCCIKWVASAIGEFQARLEQCRPGIDVAPGVFSPSGQISDEPQVYVRTPRLHLLNGWDDVGRDIPHLVA
jgi:hypothetical protein